MMKLESLDKLSKLRGLDRGNRSLRKCKICGSAAAFFDVVDFYKCCAQPDFYPFGISEIPVAYFRCRVCEFIFTEFFDDWTSEEFSKYIYNGDYIKVDPEYAGARPERDAIAMARRLSGHNELRILDYGSGSGLFAKHLRAAGFPHASSYDPFSEPGPPTGEFDLITCSEVLEHSLSPKSTLAEIFDLLAAGGCVIFQTGLQPPDIDKIRANWWYVAPRNGHCSIYTPDSLALVGQHFNMSLYIGDGGTCFAGVEQSSMTSELIASVGRQRFFLWLLAPNRDILSVPGEENNWHGPEMSATQSYRWTRESEVSWSIDPPPREPCDLSIFLPCHMEVEPGFAERCFLRTSSEDVRLNPRNGGFSASTSVTGPEDTIITLVTPPLKRPCDLRSVTDDRLLGLAISMDS